MQPSRLGAGYLEEVISSFRRLPPPAGIRFQVLRGRATPGRSGLAGTRAECRGTSVRCELFVRIDVEDCRKVPDGVLIGGDDHTTRMTEPFAADVLGIRGGGWCRGKESRG